MRGRFRPIAALEEKREYVLWQGCKLHQFTYWQRWLLSLAQPYRQPLLPPISLGPRLLQRAQSTSGKILRKQGSIRRLYRTYGHPRAHPSISLNVTTATTMTILSWIFPEFFSAHYSHCKGHRQHSRIFLPPIPRTSRVLIGGIAEECWRTSFRNPVLNFQNTVLPGTSGCAA